MAEHWGVLLNRWLVDFILGFVLSDTWIDFGLTCVASQMGSSFLSIHIGLVLELQL